jgi:hypothetical protein
LSAVWRLLVTAAAALAVVGSAVAAGPAVPAGEQAQLAALLGQLGATELALVPTRLPSHYAFESFSVTGTPAGLDVSLIDQRYLADPTAARVREISFDTAYYNGPLGTCGRRASRAFRLGRTTVYSDGSAVWRCLSTPRRRAVIVSAHGRLAPGALAALIASARPVTTR